MYLIPTRLVCILITYSNITLLKKYKNILIYIYHEKIPELEIHATMIEEKNKQVAMMVLKNCNNVS